jgi:hypothetical protein
MANGALSQPMQLPFFSVSVRKLIVMHVVTLGMYQLYWFYRHWIAVRNFNQIYISPAVRTLLSVIFAFNLFKRILDSSNFTRASSIGLAAVLGTFLLATSIAMYLPPQYFFIATLALLPTLPVQMLANRANNSVDPTHAVNSKFSILNWIAIAIGGILLLLVLAGAMLTVFEAN